MENMRAQQIESLLDVKRFDDAIKEALSALSSFPDSYYLQTLLVRAHMGADNDREAEVQCRCLIKNHPHDAFSYYLASLVFHNNKKFTSELETAEIAAKLEPDDALMLKRLAEAQLQNGMLKAAKQCSERMLVLAPEDAGSFELCGQIALESDDYRSAEKHLKEALRLVADDVHVLNLLAISLQAQKRDKEAIDLIFVALRNRPESEPLRENLFAFIKAYMDRNTLGGGRHKVLAELPNPVQMFYLDYKKRTNVFQRYSNYVMYAFWVVFITVFTLIINYFS
ncbi:MAG: hypothetical protein COA42_07330 [Alteromonadaceae bacterium]|nr:MAG: hypothetical protein COA42_07330 [Alteromonadaceae bacterium]